VDSPGTVPPLGVILRGLPNLRAGPGFGLAIRPTKRRLGEYRVVEQADGIERTGSLASVTVPQRHAVRCWHTAIASFSGEVPVTTESSHVRSWGCGEGVSGPRADWRVQGT
jgi:hypothetical protein